MIFGIKKTTILHLSFVLIFILYVASVVLSFTVFKVDNLWFFGFCTATGSVLIIKSGLFKLDSSCYFGLILFFVGFFYFYSIIFDVQYIYSCFVILSFSISSFVTAIYFYQPFQFILSLSLFFAAIIAYLFVLQVISLTIFLAILGVIMLLLISGLFVIK